MDLQAAIEQSELWMIASSSLADGLEIDSSIRNRTAASLFHICTEHQQAIHVLISSGLSGSAFALMRPQFEAYTRGAWYQHVASDSKIAAFIRGGEPPKIALMLSDLESISNFDYQLLQDTKKSVWGILNNFTHGGSIQVNARMTATEITRSYQLKHIVAMLRWSATLSYLGFIGMTTIASNEKLALELREKFLLIYAGD